VALLACVASTFLGGGSTVFAAGLALVPSVNVMQVCEVLGARMVPAVYPPKRLQRLADSGDALGRLTTHVCLIPFPIRSRRTPERGCGPMSRQRQW
jgi:hypothetical protein